MMAGNVKGVWKCWCLLIRYNGQQKQWESTTSSNGVTCTFWDVKNILWSPLFQSKHVGNNSFESKMVSKYKSSNPLAPWPIFVVVFRPKIRVIFIEISWLMNNCFWTSIYVYSSTVHISCLCLPLCAYKLKRWTHTVSVSDIAEIYQTLTVSVWCYNIKRDGFFCLHKSFTYLWELLSDLNGSQKNNKTINCYEVPLVIFSNTIQESSIDDENEKDIGAQCRSVSK